MGSGLFGSFRVTGVRKGHWGQSVGSGLLGLVRVSGVSQISVSVIWVRVIGIIQLSGSVRNIGVSHFGESVRFIGSVSYLGQGYWGQLAR